MSHYILITQITQAFSQHLKFESFASWISWDVNHIKLLVHVAACFNGLTSCLANEGSTYLTASLFSLIFWVTRWTSNKQAVSAGKSFWQLSKQRVVVVFNLCTFSNQWAKPSMFTFQWEVKNYVLTGCWNCCIYIIFTWKNTHEIAEELHSMFICMLDLI